MRILKVLWRHELADKILAKHQLEQGEVEEVLAGRPFVRRKGRGNRPGEDLYVVYGRTDSGRYVVVFAINKGRGVAMPISARDMTRNERKYYETHR
ncbi:MAG: BrnT family toxin [Candidatus Hydrogenedentes bacterium]|nr:BrnT family toxin [Candidatus Hydrogenedentota bacterium]